MTRKQKRQQRARVKLMYKQRSRRRYRQTRAAFNYFKWYMGIN